MRVECVRASTSWPQRGVCGRPRRRRRAANCAHKQQRVGATNVLQDRESKALLRAHGQGELRLQGGGPASPLPRRRPRRCGRCRGGPPLNGVLLPTFCSGRAMEFTSASGPDQLQPETPPEEWWYWRSQQACIQNQKSQNRRQQNESLRQGGIGFWRGAVYHGSLLGRRWAADCVLIETR